MAEEPAVTLPRRPNLLRDALKQKGETAAVDAFAAALRKASIAMREQKAGSHL